MCYVVLDCQLDLRRALSGREQGAPRTEDQGREGWEIRQDRTEEHTPKRCR